MENAASIPDLPYGKQISQINFGRAETSAALPSLIGTGSAPSEDLAQRLKGLRG